MRAGGKAEAEVFVAELVLPYSSHSKVEEFEYCGQSLGLCVVHGMASRVG